MTEFQIHICATMLKHNKPIDIFSNLTTQQLAYLFKAFQVVDYDLYGCYIIATQPTTILDRIVVSNPTFDQQELDKYILVLRSHLCK
jgi:hypothetical protein